jgi:hypothetical protein
VSEPIQFVKFKVGDKVMRGRERFTIRYINPAGMCSPQEENERPMELYDPRILRPLKENGTEFR